MLTIKPAISNYSSPRVSFGERDPEYAKRRAEYEQYSADLDEAIDNKYVPSKAKTAFKVMKIGIEGMTAALAVTYGAKKAAQLLQKGAKNFKNSDFYKATAKIFGPVKRGLADTAANVKEFFNTKYDNFLKKKWVAKKLKSARKFFKKNSFGKKLASMYKTTKEFISKKYNAVKDFFKGVTYEQGSNFTAGVLGAGSGVTAAYVAAKDEFPVKNEPAVDFDDSAYDEGDD